MIKHLKAMNRKYTSKEYLDGCNILRKYYKNPAITTDVIVGFPGETDEDFDITKAFLEKVHFYEMHISNIQEEKVQLRIRWRIRLMTGLKQ